MKDNYGDTIEISVQSDGDRDGVHVRFNRAGSLTLGADMMFSPKKARKFIRKLQQATAQVEIAQRGNA